MNPNSGIFYRSRKFLPSEQVRLFIGIAFLLFIVFNFVTRNYENIKFFWKIKIHRFLPEYHPIFTIAKLYWPLFGVLMILATPIRRKLSKKNSPVFSITDEFVIIETLFRNGKYRTYDIDRIEIDGNQIALHLNSPQKTKKLNLKEIRKEDQGRFREVIEEFNSGRIRSREDNQEKTLEKTYYLNKKITFKNKVMFWVGCVLLAFFTLLATGASVESGSLDLFKDIRFYQISSFAIFLIVASFSRKFKKSDTPFITLSDSAIILHSGNYEGKYYFCDIDRFELLSNNFYLHTKEPEKEMNFDFENIKEEEREMFLEKMKSLDIPFRIDQGRV